MEHVQEEIQQRDPLGFTTSEVIIIVENLKREKAKLQGEEDEEQKEEGPSEEKNEDDDLIIKRYQEECPLMDTSKNEQENQKASKEELKIELSISKPLDSLINILFDSDAHIDFILPLDSFDQKKEIEKNLGTLEPKGGEWKEMLRNFVEEKMYTGGLFTESQARVWHINEKKFFIVWNLRPQKGPKQVDTNITGVNSFWFFNHTWESLLKGMEFDTAHFITDASGKYPRLWALKGAHPVTVNRWYKFGALASICTVAPSFREISELSDWAFYHLFLYSIIRKPKKCLRLKVGSELRMCWVLLKGFRTTVSPAAVE
ncbi:hypothetical protein ACS0TY_021011 [Phlomoides rotata]